MMPAGSQSPHCTWHAKRASMDWNWSCAGSIGTTNYRCKRLTAQGLLGRIPLAQGRSRRFDVQLAGALQIQLKRREPTFQRGPFLAKAERAFFIFQVAIDRSATDRSDARRTTRSAVQEANHAARRRNGHNDPARAV